MSLQRSTKVSKRYSPTAAAGSTRRTRSATKMERLGQQQHMVAGPSSLTPMASVGTSQTRSRGKGRSLPVPPPALGPFNNPTPTLHPSIDPSTLGPSLALGSVDPSLLLSLPSGSAGPSTLLPPPVLGNTNRSPSHSPPPQPLSDAESKEFILQNLTKSQRLSEIPDGPLRHEIERHLRPDARRTVPFTCFLCPAALDSAKEWLAHYQSTHNIDYRDGGVVCPFSTSRHKGRRIPSFFVHHFGERELCTGCWKVALIRAKDKTTRHPCPVNTLVVKHFLLDYHPHKDRVLQMEEEAEMSTAGESPAVHETTPSSTTLPPLPPHAPPSVPHVSLRPSLPTIVLDSSPQTPPPISSNVLWHQPGASPHISPPRQPLETSPNDSISPMSRLQRFMDSSAGPNFGPTMGSLIDAMLSSPTCDRLVDPSLDMFG